MSLANSEIADRLAALTPRQRAYVERRMAGRTAGPVEHGIVPTPGVDGYRAPASFEQERLWFMDRMVPFPEVYRIPTALRVRGPLDHTAMGNALNRVVARHEVLRTCLVETPQGCMQLLRAELTVPLPLRDVSASADPEAVVREHVTKDRLAPFDLATGPMIRAALYRLGPDDHVLAIVQHHVVSDYWSLAILFTELAECYRAFSEGVEPTLPELPVQYGDFAAWQRDTVQGERLDQLTDFWRQHLAGAPALLTLPLDRPRPAQRTATGRFHPVRFAPEVVAAARRFAQDEGATLHMAVLAAYVAMLARYSGQDDVVVGVPIAGRGRTEVQPLIGYFLNWLPLRVHVGDDPTFRELLDRVRTASMAGYRHQDVPFEVLVQALRPERNLATTPIFQTSLSLRDSAPSLPGFGAAKVEQFGVDGAASHFDLMVELWVDTDDAVVGNLPYNEELFDESTVARAAGHLNRLLTTGPANPDVPISAAEMVDPDETVAVCRTPTEPVNTDLTLSAMVGAQARARPDAVAVSDQDRQLTYAELDAAADRVAARVLGLGVVGICLERSVDYVVAALGVLKAGAAYLPLDPDHPPARIASLVADAGAATVVTTSALADRVDGPTVLVDDLPDGVPPAIEISPDAAAYVLYTSGTTGKPKGVVVTHRNVAALLASARQVCSLGPDDVWSVFHASTFDFSVWELWGALATGGRAVIVPQWTTRAPDGFADLVASAGVTVLSQTPSAFAQLTTVLLARPELARSLRYVVFGGEAMYPRSLGAWFDQFGDSLPELVTLYGITETTVHVTFRRIRAVDVTRADALVGPPLPGLSLYLLDRAMRPVPVGVPGEIHVGGGGVTRGYLGDPGRTADRFRPDPFGGPGARMYASGDLARLTADGELVYLGRMDRQVKIRGRRIEPGEVQGAIAGLPGVAAAAVVARYDAPGGGARLVGYFVPTDGGGTAGRPAGPAADRTVRPVAGKAVVGGVAGAAAGPVDLRTVVDGAAGSAADRTTRQTVVGVRRALRKLLPEYLVPAAVVELDALPMTANGKLDVARLPAPGGPVVEPVTYVPPATPEEHALVEIWQELLGVQQVGTAANFFELGGHSLMIVQLVGRIREKLGVEPSMAQLFQRPVLADMAAGLAAGGPAAATLDDDPLAGLSDEEIEAMLDVARGDDR